MFKRLGVHTIVSNSRDTQRRTVLEPVLYRYRIAGVLLYRTTRTNKASCYSLRGYMHVGVENRKSSRMCPEL